MRKSVTIISITLTLLFITKSASALTLSEVLSLTPAFHVIEEIYVKIAGSYYPISEWVQFTSQELSVKKQVRIDNLKSCGKLYTDSSGNVKCGVDQVNDADPNPTNELQTLYRSGNSICISKTGSCVTDRVGLTSCRLECTSVSAGASKQRVVEVYCPSGYTVVSCNGFARCISDNDPNTLDKMELFGTYKSGNGCKTVALCLHNNRDSSTGTISEDFWHDPWYIMTQAICCKMVCS